MPAEDSGLEFEEDLDQTPSARPTSAERGRPGAARQAGREGHKRGDNKSKARASPTRRGGRPGRIGKAAPPRREKPKVTVRVVGLDRAFEAEAGRDLRNACRDNHVNVFWGPWAQAFNCRGVATCGLCTVDVVEGRDQLTPRTKKEEKRLRGKPASWRLACHAKLSGDVRIDPLPRIPVDQQVSEEAIRRALLTDEERERLREDAKQARQAEREQAKGTEAAPKEKKGLLARLQKKDDDKKAKPGDRESSSRGLLGRKGKEKGGKKSGKKGKQNDADKAGRKSAKKDADRPANNVEHDEPGAAKASASERDDAKPAKKSFGLKSRKS